MTSSRDIAINGGPPLRDRPLPPRRAFGESELEMVSKVFDHSWETGWDFGFQGQFEDEFCANFCEFQSGGYADAVSSGSAAVYLALLALDLPDGSDVVVSPVCNPGGIMPVAVQNVKLVIPDTNVGCFNISPDAFERAITPKTRAAVLTHLGGHCIDIDSIMEIAAGKGIRVIEDCSQSPGALYKGRRVGTFGDMAAFSTMYSKTLATGGCGGMVYTKSEEYYWRVRSLADRGKPFESSNFDLRDTTAYKFPALNFNANEISCAIGIATLSKLQRTIDERRTVAYKLDVALEDSKVIHPSNLELPGTVSSPFFHTVLVDVDKIAVSKVEFAAAVAAEGIWINGDYRDITSEWPWVRAHVRDWQETPNAIDFRNRTFNILTNERFSDDDVRDILRCIQKVESYYLKS